MRIKIPIFGRKSYMRCRHLQHICSFRIFEELTDVEQGKTSYKAWGRWEGCVFASVASQKLRA